MPLYNIIWFGYNNYSPLSGSSDIFANDSLQAKSIIKSILIHKNITVETIRVSELTKDFYYQNKNRESPV